MDLPLYHKDILNNGFEQLSIPQTKDYEGKVVCTLVRKLCTEQSNKAVLYIHGFNDYFFQEEMANKFNANGLNFYALDLRKYGRSYRIHQRFNGLRNISEYYEDINASLKQIEKEGNTAILLAGHSTGGLIVSLYADKHKNNTLIKAVWTNSPFYAFNKPAIVRSLIIPIASTIGRFFPNLAITDSFSPAYGESLHISKHGEWDYNLDWKPIVAKSIKFGFINAIYSAQKKVKQGLHINVPMLIMSSDKTLHLKKYDKTAHYGDCVLSVEQINKYAKKIKGDITILKISNGLHDLVLSQKNIREDVYKQLFNWLSDIKHFNASI